MKFEKCQGHVDLQNPMRVPFLFEYNMIMQVNKKGKKVTQKKDEKENLPNPTIVFNLNSILNI